MTFHHRAWFFLAALGVAGFGLAACGGDDSIGADDPLVQAIADQILAEEEGDETGGVFGGDQATAECFGVEVVRSVGKDRLNDLGFTVDNIPDEFQTDWSAEEIDTIIDGIDRCVDIVAATKRTLLAGASEEEVACVFGETGEDYLLDVFRAGFEAGSGNAAQEAAQEAAIEAAYAPLIAAYETCGVPLFG